MTRLKLGPIKDDRPVKATVELPASLHRDLVAYAEALGRQTGQPVSDPLKLVVPMLRRFIATDREFGRTRNIKPSAISARPSSRYAPSTGQRQDPETA